MRAGLVVGIALELVSSPQAVVTQFYQWLVQQQDRSLRNDDRSDTT